ncbi:MAG: hypothetical protein BHV62_04955 [Eggerthella sp. 51_9]|nr:MAG: hypothetical protein BHV62_04955 [Eggerthella sp. 51_9]
MAKRFVAVLVTLCAVLAALCLSGCAEEGGKPSYQLVSEGKLTVAMAPNFPPFDSLDGETPTGFDVSVAREVANRLGLQLEIKAVPFDELVQGVHDGTYDVAISALSINPSRSELVDFSSPYYLVDQAIVAKKGVYEKVSELKGKQVAAEAEATGYDYAMANVTQNVVTYKTAAECFNVREICRCREQGQSGLNRCHQRRPRPDGQRWNSCRAPKASRVGVSRHCGAPFLDMALTSRRRVRGSALAAEVKQPWPLP